MADGGVRLQPPGAGLPYAELLLARAGLRLARLLLSRDRAAARFRAEGDIALRLARSLPPADAARRVLVPRLWGLEDSSRFWSVFMVLDHLTIVNDAVAAIIEHLAAGRPFPRAIGIADVKPRPGAGPGALDELDRADRAYLAATGAVGDLRTRLTYPHPWFGPLDGHGWHCLAALHQTIHRRQVERIIRKLRRERGGALP
jgi:hypothetical protein